LINKYHMWKKIKRLLESVLPIKTVNLLQDEQMCGETVKGNKCSKLSQTEPVVLQIKKKRKAKLS